MADVEVAVVGAGVVGCATALELRRRGASVALLEAEPAPGLAASGTNSGILHTGFDSTPGELETELILRSAEIRDPVLDGLGVPVLRCGAVLRPSDAEGRATVARLAERAERNGVYARVDEDGSLEVPGEAVTDPVAYTARRSLPRPCGCGAELRTRCARGRRSGEIGGRPRARERRRRAATRRVVVNCAGLHADEVARAGRRRLVRDLSAQGRVPGVRPPARATARRRSCCPSRRSGRRACWCFRRSTARWWRGRPRWTRRTRATGRCAPQARRRDPPARAARCTRRSRARSRSPPTPGLRPAGRGVNYLIGHVRGMRPARERGGDPVHRPHAPRSGSPSTLSVVVAASASTLGELERRRSSRPARSPPTVPWWRRTRASTERRMSRPLLLGIDEGTSAVKAVLYDADLTAAGARPGGRSRSTIRSPGGSSRTREDVLVAVVDAVAEVLRDASTARWSPAASTTRASRCSPGRPRAASRSRRSSTWQDKRSQEVLDRLEAEGRADEVRERSGLPLDPYFSAGKLDVAARARRGRGRRARRRDAAARHGRLVALRRARGGLRHRSLHGVAHAAAVPGAPDWDPSCSSRSACPRDALPAIRDSAGDLGTLRHPDGRVELPLRAQLSWTSRPRWPGAGCVSRAA